MRICPQTINEDPILKKKMYVVFKKNGSEVQLVYCYSEQKSAADFVAIMNQNCVNLRDRYDYREVLMVS